MFGRVLMKMIGGKGDAALCDTWRFNCAEACPLSGGGATGLLRCIAEATRMTPSLTESEKGLIQKVAGEVLPESVTG
jgi:hypothetical protein